MKKLLLVACAIAMMGCARSTRMTLHYEGLTSDELYLSVAEIGQPIGQVTDTLHLEDGRATYTVDNETPIAVWLMPRDFLFDEQIEGGVRMLRNGGGFMELFLAPRERVTLHAQSYGAHVTAEVQGSILNREVVALRNERNPLLGELYTAAQSGDYVTMMQTGPKMTAQLTAYIEANPANESAAYALSQLDKECLPVYFDKVDAVAFEGLLSPLKESLQLAAEGQRVLEGAKETIAEGREAPDFTLPNLAGESVSLRSLRGKWVVLDFWGSWCGWCIKGFPRMKEVYAKYSDRMEIVGIACKDQEEPWRAAVEKYELPWLQLFNAQDLRPTESPMHCYGVEGFPTKIILSPEGVIHRIFVGESEDFYRALEQALK
ncbi:MAG: TlpA family protein disulfide reductase [Alistipes sp.]|nr:TlpA family protein disulfide reductase [Alistipes sp.]